jgi:hypothetical protein
MSRDAGMLCIACGNFKFACVNMINEWKIEMFSDLQVMTIVILTEILVN